MTKNELIGLLNINLMNSLRQRDNTDSGLLGMPCIQIGRTLRYKLDTVMSWLESQNEKESA